MEDALGNLNEDSDVDIGTMVRLAPEGLGDPLPPPPLPAPASLPHVPSRGQEDLSAQREELKQIRAVLNTIVMILAPRALVFIAMVAVFALFMVALFMNDAKLLVAAGVFGMIIFFPTAILYWKG